MSEHIRDLETRHHKRRPKILVSLVTSSELPESEFDRVAHTLLALEDVDCVNWIQTDRLSKVAQGTLVKSFGQPVLHAEINNKKLVFPTMLFQVNTPGFERPSHILPKHVEKPQPWLISIVV